MLFGSLSCLVGKSTMFMVPQERCWIDLMCFFFAGCIGLLVVHFFEKARSLTNYISGSSLGVFSPGKNDRPKHLNIPVRAPVHGTLENFGCIDETLQIIPETTLAKPRYVWLTVDNFCWVTSILDIQIPFDYVFEPPNMSWECICGFQTPTPQVFGGFWMRRAKKPFESCSMCLCQV